MARRSHRFAQHWHRRELYLADGEILRWVLIDGPVHGATHVECGKLQSSDGLSTGLHPTQLRRLLTEHGHADAEHVKVDTPIGQRFTR